MMYIMIVMNTSRNQLILPMFQMNKADYVTDAFVYFILLENAFL